MRGGGGVGVLSIACVAAAEDALNADETAQRWVALERASTLKECLKERQAAEKHRVQRVLQLKHEGKPKSHSMQWS